MRGGEVQVEVQAASILGGAALGGRPEADSSPSEAHCPLAGPGLMAKACPLFHLHG